MYSGSKTINLNNTNSIIQLFKKLIKLRKSLVIADNQYADLRSPLCNCIFAVHFRVVHHQLTNVSNIIKLFHK